jgi:[ribosomal protein S18]-alanine N-acetyltransferase
MPYTIQPMRIRDTLQLSTWRYDGVYAAYDFKFWDLVGIFLSEMIFRLLGNHLYYSVYNQHGELIGMFSFYPRDGNHIEVGLGMRPDQTGRGVGLSFVQAGLDYARERFHPAYFQLNVANFNQRAYLVYERAGFTPTGTSTRRAHGKVEDYIKMSRPA